MSEEERRRCCLLGGCGCGPAGSAVQREAMREWLIEKLATSDLPGKLCDSTDSVPSTVDTWLDELPWDKEQTTTLTPKMAGFVGEAGDAVLQAREDGKKEGRREALKGLIEFMQHGLENP